MNCKSNVDDVYLVEGLKHHLFNVDNLNNKGYHLQFKECMCRNLEILGDLISIRRQIKGKLPI